MYHVRVARLRTARGRLKESTTLSPKRGTEAMRFTGIANSEQLGVLCQALEQYCAAHKIAGNDERENVASLIVWLFARGGTRRGYLMR